jgi:hypothetical protein
LTSTGIGAGYNPTPAVRIPALARRRTYRV